MGSQTLHVAMLSPSDSLIGAALRARDAFHAGNGACTADAPLTWPEQFRDYAISLRDRWHARFEIFMTGGHLSKAEPEFPAILVGAVSEELAAAG